MSKPSLSWVSKWRIFAAMAACGSALVGHASSQQATPAASAPPLPPMRPKTPVHWIITYQQREAAPVPSADANGQKNRRLIKEDYQLDGQTAAVNRFYSDGTEQKTYIVKGIAFIAQDQHVRAEMLTEGSGRGLRFSGSFPGFEWLKADFFVDAPEQSGKKLTHYRQPPTKGKGGTTYDPYATQTDREAWIDQDSHLPFAFREGGLSGVYQFETTTDQKITLPPEIEKAIRYYNGYR